MPQYGNCARPTAAIVVSSVYCPPDTLLIAVLKASFAEKNSAPAGMRTQVGNERMVWFVGAVDKNQVYPNQRMCLRKKRIV